MATTRAATTIPITATFYHHDGIKRLEMPAVIDTEHGINQIVITLKTEPQGDKTASFAKDPPGALQWLDAAGQLTPTPPSFRVVYRPFTLEIWDINTTTFTLSHHFWLAVEFDRIIYFQDPTIINQKPG